MAAKWLISQHTLRAPLIRLLSKLWAALTDVLGVCEKADVWVYTLQGVRAFLRVCVNVYNRERGVQYRFLMPVYLGHFSSRGGSDGSGNKRLGV